MPSERFAERILRFVQNKSYRPQRVHEIAKALGIIEDERDDFQVACKALLSSGRLVLGASRTLALPSPSGTITGTYRSNRRGFGFVIPDTPNSHGDLYIPVGAARDAISGDIVSVRVQRRGKRQGKMVYEGRVQSIVRRGQSRFVGELRCDSGKWLVFPDGQTLRVPVLVGDPGAKNGRAGDQVVIEITQFPAEYLDARGVVVKVLGPRGDPDVNTLSVMEQFHLPGEFSEEVLDEARAVARGFNAQSVAGEREDMRDVIVVTIDPTDARDFDDAISIEKKSAGRVELGVHIADVSYFVRPGSALDEETRTRSTSVYLGRTVVPMLPELLSNGVCSLQEREPRLAKSVFITYDRKGCVVETRVANTVIKSAKRLTYVQAMGILEGKPGRTSTKVVAVLGEMEKLAQRIRKRRLSEGMLVLDIPEVDLVYDDSGVVVDVTPTDQSFTHTIIEMFMVEANEAVAQWLEARNVPFLRRIHPNPGDATDGSLRRFVSVLGYELPQRAERHDIQTLLDDVRDKPEAFAVHLAVLRSMKQAEYSPAKVGHYALASRNYCHFTSPIRRYPDLTVHRLIDSLLAGEQVANTKEVAKSEEVTKSEDGDWLDEDALFRLGAQCSETERRAESAERELKLVGVLGVLEQFVGEEFLGVVTGVVNFGLFVQLERFLVDGLLRFDDLPDDWWEVDPDGGLVVGERSGRTIRLGDRLKVTLTSVHLGTRNIGLALVGPLPRSGETRSGRKRKPSQKVRPAKKQGGPKRKTASGRSKGKRPSYGKATGGKRGRKR